MFENFPKKRPNLGQKYRDIHEAYYKANRIGNTFACSLSQRMEAWMHRMVASDGIDNVSDSATLELGAGSLNHLRYEPYSCPYDAVEPCWERYGLAPENVSIRNLYRYIDEIPSDQSYGRIISIAVLEHICNLPKVIAKAGLLLAPQGEFRAAIPSHGGWLWTLAWRCTTGLEFRLKHGMSLRPLMEHEHVNTSREIADVLGFFFKKVRTVYLGLGNNFSFYQFIVCSVPTLSRCESYLKKEDIANE